MFFLIYCCPSEFSEMLLTDLINQKQRRFSIVAHVKTICLDKSWRGTEGAKNRLRLLWQLHLTITWRFYTLHYDSIIIGLLSRRVRVPVLSTACHHQQLILMNFLEFKHGPQHTLIGRLVHGILHRLSDVKFALIHLLKTGTHIHIIASCFLISKLCLLIVSIWCGRVPQLRASKLSVAVLIRHIAMCVLVLLFTEILVNIFATCLIIAARIWSLTYIRGAWTCWTYVIIPILRHIHIRPLNRMTAD